MTVVLHGYRYSVYAWIARLALAEKGVAHDWAEVDPFAPDVPTAYLDLHPFGRVPTFVHDGFTLYETQAITRYVDEAFAGPALQPKAPASRARMNQILGVADAYVYWPLVRQAFSHGYFRPRMGRDADAAEAAAGLAAAPRILDALERLADADGPFLLGAGVSLADVHLAPMLDYFAKALGAVAQLDARPRLAGWRTGMAARPSVRATAPEI